MESRVPGAPRRHIRHPRADPKGAKFDARGFHDFILSQGRQGLLPPDLLRQAVLEELIPRWK
ncbi:MAG TPA: hypothetical protein VN750_10300 [Steroidobacteraceae bacterium]|nr:hypothetical protein [Steroidobacteraceae bacterium]